MRNALIFPFSPRTRARQGQKFPKLIVKIFYLVSLDEECTYFPETRYLRERKKLIINKKVEFRYREHVMLAGKNKKTGCSMPFFNLG